MRLIKRGLTMKKNKYWLLILVIVLSCCILSMKLFGISIMEEAQTATYGFSTLHGLDGVYSPRVCVMSRTLQDSFKNAIEGTENEFDEACFSIQKELREKVLLLIQKAEIRIIPTPKNNYRGEDATYISIKVTIRKPLKDEQFYAFTVQTELSQNVQLVRNPKIMACVPTWPNNSLDPPNIFFVAGFSEMKEAIRNEVTNQIKQFTEDYLAANPKNKR
jgi:hypothetical protein